MRLTLAAALAATAAGVTHASAQGSSPTQDRRWVVLIQNAAIRASLDTSRVERDSSGTRVWVRFEYTAEQPALDGMSAPYHQLNVREHVDCAGSRSRNLVVEVVDTAGRAYLEPGTEQPWLSFREHPLTPTFFLPLCRELGAPDRTREGAQPSTERAA